jgi:drug/metabolite transporter (DMT)-like permease
MPERQRVQSPSKSNAALSLAAGIATVACPIAVAASGAPFVMQGRTGPAAWAWLFARGVCLGVIAFTNQARRAVRRETAKFAYAGLAVAGLVVAVLSILCLFGRVPSPSRSAAKWIAKRQRERAPEI